MEEGIDSEEVEFQKTEISNLIADWESRAGGGDLLKPPELEDRGRRRSQEFTNLRLKFMEHSGGVGDDLKTARPMSETLLARPSANSKRKWDQQEGLDTKRRFGN